MKKILQERIDTRMECLKKEIERHYKRAEELKDQLKLSQIGLPASDSDARPMKKGDNFLYWPVSGTMDNGRIRVGGEINKDVVLYSVFPVWNGKLPNGTRVRISNYSAIFDRTDVGEPGIGTIWAFTPKGTRVYTHSRLEADLGDIAEEDIYWVRLDRNVRLPMNYRLERCTKADVEVLSEESPYYRMEVDTLPMEEQYRDLYPFGVCFVRYSGENVNNATNISSQSEGSGR